MEGGSKEPPSIVIIYVYYGNYLLLLTSPPVVADLSRTFTLQSISEPVEDLACPSLALSFDALMLAPVEASKSIVVALHERLIDEPVDAFALTMSWHVISVTVIVPAVEELQSKALQFILLMITVAAVVVSISISSLSRLI